MHYSGIYLDGLVENKENNVYLNNMSSHRFTNACITTFNIDVDDSSYL